MQVPTKCHQVSWRSSRATGIGIAWTTAIPKPTVSMVQACSQVSPPQASSRMRQSRTSIALVHISMTSSPSNVRLAIWRWIMTSQEWLQASATRATRISCRKTYSRSTTTSLPLRSRVTQPQSFRNMGKSPPGWTPLENRLRPILPLTRRTSLTRQSRRLFSRPNPIPRYLKTSD